VPESQQHHGDPSIPLSHVAVRLQVRILSHQSPHDFIARRPTLPKNTSAYLSSFGHLEQALLNRNANVAARTGGSVPVYDFEKGMALLPRDGNLTFEPLQRLGNRRPIRLEIYCFDGSGNTTCKYSGLSSACHRLSGIFICGAAALCFTFIPKLFAFSER